jgi:transposase
VEDARAGGSTALGADLPDKLRQRYDHAVAFGITHDRLRDWDGGGNHPGYTLGCWLRDFKEQVFLFTRDFAVDWTDNVSERGAKAARRHQAVCGYWHSLATLARWCRIRSYLDSAANHGLTALDAVSAALAGQPWLPAIPDAA